MRAPQDVLPRRPAAHDPARVAIAAAIVLGIALRLAFAFGYWVEKPLTLDEREYLLLATSIARGEGLKYPASAESAVKPDPGPTQAAVRHFERPPAFAFFLAGILRVTRDPLVAAPRDDTGMPRGFPRSSTGVPAAIRIAQSLIGGLVIALIAALAWEVAGRAGAVIAAVLAAVYAPLASSSGYVLSEPLYSALALGLVWLLQRAAGGGVRLAFAAGVLAGVAVLTKESMIFFLPFAGAWLLARRRYVATVGLALGVALVMMPWIARNYEVYGRFVLTAPHGGVTFWTGNNPLARGEGDLAANPEMGRARVAFEQRRAGATTQEMDNAYYRDAFRFIAGNPSAWSVLLAKKFFYTFVPIGPSYRLHSRLYYLATAGSYAVLFPFAVLGFAAIVRTRRFGHLTALWLLALSAVVVCLVFFPQDRFRLPVLDPVVVVCTSAWWASLAIMRRWLPAAPDLQGSV